MQAVRAPEVLARYLRDQILTDGFPIGSPLPPERDLAQQSGFGRSTVREAIKMLAAEGLVKAEGTERRLVVTEPDTMPMRRVSESFVRWRRSTLGALIQVRLIVEPEASGLAAELHNATALDSLNEATLSLEQATDVEEHFLRCNAEWHSAVAAATGNQALESVVETMTHITYRGTASFYQRSEDAEIRDGVLKAHRKILSAIERGNGEEARRAMRHHLDIYRRIAVERGVLDRPIPMQF